MKALSIKQPHLWAITDRDKRIENRTWKPPEWIIGQRIALHASKKDDPVGAVAINSISGYWPPQDLPRGCIVATACIIGYRSTTISVSYIDHLINDKWFIGPIGWILDDTQKLETPIPCQGALGLWNIPQEILIQF